ncbi:MAG: hypothetical protein JWN70_2674 [Planctomycetaceae bacterium]|nr:hypothetical protein [Planctomycetaceae bacterium]
MPDYITPNDLPKCEECHGTGRVTATVEGTSPIGGNQQPPVIVREIVCPCCGGTGTRK